MTIELRQVVYFLAVAETGNFTRAAEKVGIKQPPLSQQIQALERIVGARLFRRTVKGAELTEPGRAFLAAISPVPIQIEQALREARRAARGEWGSLRIGFTGSAAFNPFVFETIRHFRRGYPDVDLTLEEANTPGLVAGALEGSYDAVFLRPGSDGSEALAQRHAPDEPMVAVLPDAHPACSGSGFDLGDLREDPFILLPIANGPVLYQAIMSACRLHGFEPKLGQWAPQIGSTINLVAAGLGVSIVPRSMACLRVPGVVFREIVPDPPIARLSLAFRKGPLSPVLANFVGLATRKA